MKVLVCGDRKWQNREVIKKALLQLPSDTIIIHGDARGADTIAGIIAGEIGLMVKPYPANWEDYGRAAGPIRNKLMLDKENPDEVWAFHNDLHKSKGTKDMVRQAEKRGVTVRRFTSKTWG